MTIKKFENVIIDLIKKFNSNPFSYFYEEDLRATLAFNLSKCFNEIKYKVRSDFTKSLNINEFYSNPIKCEYPQNKGKENRFDLVYIEDVGQDFYNCEVRIAVELKLGSHIYDRLGKFRQDIEKLQNKLNKSIKSQFLGIGLYFYQGEIDFKSIKEWFPQNAKDIEEVPLSVLENIDFKPRGLEILIISKNSLFILSF